MKKVSQFFDKFNSGATKEIQKRVIICEIIKKEINQEIPMENISFNNGIVKVKGSSGLKSQILIKKTKLLKLISEKLINLKISDIC